MDAPARGPLLGPFLEGFVPSEIARQLTWSSRRVELSHYRTEDGVEVNAVLEDRQGRRRIEMKASSTVRADDFRGLRHLAERLGDDFLLGVVLYTGTDTLPFGDRAGGPAQCPVAAWVTRRDPAAVSVARTGGSLTLTLPIRQPREERVLGGARRSVVSLHGRDRGTMAAVTTARLGEVFTEHDVVVGLPVRVAGRACASSDHDVAVLFGPTPAWDAVVRLADALAPLLGTATDVVDLDAAPLELRGQVAERGRLLYSADETRRACSPRRASSTARWPSTWSHSPARETSSSTCRRGGRRTAGHARP